jgi:hypothetical protein
MTEAEWNRCSDPWEMLEFLRNTSRASDRKLRLFAVGCCRRLEAELPDQSSWDVVHLAEGYADGNGTDQDLMEARRDAEESFRRHMAAFAAVQVTAPLAWDAAMGAVEAVDYLGWEYYEEGEEREQGQTGLLRDLFGPLPFRAVAIDPAWLGWNDGTVRRIAEGIYEERAFERMPILADALEDAGCDSEEILAHCRQPGAVHVRGCWVVDRLLAKE